MDLAVTSKIVGGKLEEIARCFVDEIKITLIARLPNNDEADFILSSDDLRQAKYAIERRYTALLKKQGITEEDMVNDTSYPESIA